MGMVVPLLREERRQTPRRKPNAQLRTREHLMPDEVQRLIDAAKGNRWGHRDGTMHPARLPARAAGVGVM